MLCLRIGEETYVAILKPEWTICKGKIIWRHMREWRWNNIRNTKHTFVLSCWHGCGELKGDVLQSFWLWQALLCAVLRERQMGTVPVCSLDVLCASILEELECEVLSWWFLCTPALHSCPFWSCMPWYVKNSAPFEVAAVVLRRHLYLAVWLIPRGVGLKFGFPAGSFLA